MLLVCCCFYMYIYIYKFSCAWRNKLDDPVRVFILPFIFLKSGERSRRGFWRQIPRKGSESGCIVWRHDRVWIAGNHMRSVQNPWPHERVTGKGITASGLLFFADDAESKWCPKQSFVPPRCLWLEPRTCEVFSFQVLCAGIGYRTRERFRGPQAFWSRKARAHIVLTWLRCLQCFMLGGRGVETICASAVAGTDMNANLVLSRFRV